jgi:hypothetical protein
MRSAWLRICVDGGDHLRDQVGDDLLLAHALRVLLPPYTGPALKLYRGDSARNWCHGTYGLSWSGNQVSFSS